MMPSAICQLDEQACDAAEAPTNFLGNDQPLVPFTGATPQGADLHGVRNYLRPCNPNTPAPMWPMPNRNSA